MASSALKPRICSISSATRTGSALGRSILLMTGMISRPDFDGGVGVGDGLGLHALRGIDDEDGAFASLEGFLDFVVEIDVAGGVDESSA